MSRCRFDVSILTWLAGVALCAAAQPSKPIALAGASYGTHEVRSIVRNVLSASPDHQVVYENLGAAVQAGEFDRFSLVIIAHSLAQPFTPEESRAAAAYLDGGGHMLLINTAPRFMAQTIGLTNMTWAGITRVDWHRAGAPCKVLKQGAGWLEGVFDAGQEPAWLVGSILASVPPDGMQNIIGTTSGSCLFGVHAVGKGWVAYLGHELFRLRSKNSNTRPDSPSWIRLIGNIIAAAEPLTQGELREQALQAMAGRELLIWDREWQKGESYGPRFDPPLPAESEFVTALAADMAVDEYELLQLNLTPLLELGSAQARFETGPFPQDHVRLFVQDRPDAIPWEKNPDIAQEFPYWLIPPEYVLPKGRAEFNMPARETRILWIKLNSFGVPPGSYSVTLHLDFAGGKHVELPISVTVYPVRMPRRRLIKLMPGGTVYGDVNDVGPAIRFMTNLESHGFEWSVYNAIRPWVCRVRDDTAVLDVGYVSRHRDRFLAGDYPPLSFAAFDGWVEQSIAHNQTLVRIGDVGHYLRATLTRAGIDGDAQLPVEQWFAKEFSRYLREKGIRFMVTSIGDELSKDELIAHFLPWAKRMSEAGWGCSSSFTGMVNTEPEMNGILAPHVKLWTLNRGTIVPFTEGLRSGLLTVRPDAMVGTYGAGAGSGTEIRKAPSLSRYLGWESWMLGVQNCMPNPYFKGWIYYCDYTTRDMGLAGERFVSFLDKDDLAVPLANSPFLEGIREGLEDGNLCAILSWYLEHMPATSTTADVRARLQKVLGNTPDVLLKWHETKHPAGYRHRVLEADSARYRTAKRTVLECLAQLRPEAIRAVQPTLYWNDVPLVKEGKPLAAIYATDAAADELVSKMTLLCGIALPVVRNAAALDPRYPSAIVLGSGARHPLAKRLLAEHGEADADLSYPGAGSYFVKELNRPDAADGRILIVAGCDSAGTAKGIQLFGTFLHSDGAWILGHATAREE